MMNMEPFIKDALVDGRYNLPLQVEGVDRGSLTQLLLGEKLIAYSIPQAQSLICAWEFRLYFSHGLTLDFSSATTGVGGWDELNSLNILFSKKSNTLPNKHNQVQYSFGVISDIKLLVFDEGNIYAECGVSLINQLQEELVIACSISPGSVSVKLRKSDNGFEPEMDENDYMLVSL